MDKIGPHNIHHTRGIYSPDGRVHTRQVNEDFFPGLAQQFPDFAGHVLFSNFDFDIPWDTWEIHPEGDEIVYLLKGDTDFILHDGTAEVSRLRISEPGQYIIVPQGLWHTAIPHRETSMLFFTPGNGTINALEPGGDAL